MEQSALATRIKDEDSSLAARIEEKAGPIMGLKMGLMSAYEKYGKGPIERFLDVTPEEEALWDLYREKKHAPERPMGTAEYTFADFVEETLAHTPQPVEPVS